MDGEEGARIGYIAGEKVQSLRDKALSSGLSGTMFRDFFVDNSCSGPSEGLRTYKRRKHMSSDSRCQEDWKRFVEAACTLADEITKETADCFPEKHLDGSNDILHKEYRNCFLGRIYQSLHDEGGIKGCIKDALMMRLKDSDAGRKDASKSATAILSGWRPTGTRHAAKGNVDVSSSESADNSHRPVTKTCKEAFLNILLTEKFTILCKLLSENFHEMKPDNPLSLSCINTRMKDGSYESSPSLFYVDIQRVWRKLQGIGNELISLARSLSDVSKTSYDEHVCPPEAYFCGKLDKKEVYLCRLCGGKTEMTHRFHCYSCEDIYHGACLEPVLRKHSGGRWFCPSCTVRGMQTSHENCAVCVRLNADGAQCNQHIEDGSPSIENVLSELEEFEESTSNNGEEFHQALTGGESVSFCKICGCELQNGEKIKICERAGCPYKHYHVRCLTTNLLRSHGPRWYCPSCLCRECLTDRDNDRIVLCDCCSHAYHMYCMRPPCTTVLSGKWFCVPCGVNVNHIRFARMHHEKQESMLKKRPESYLKRKMKQAETEREAEMKRKPEMKRRAEMKRKAQMARTARDEAVRKAEKDKIASEKPVCNLDDTCEQESEKGPLDILMRAALAFTETLGHT